VGAHARVRTAAFAAALGATTIAGGAAATDAVACSTSAPCYAVDTFTTPTTSIQATENYAIMKFEAWSVPASGERTDFALTSIFGAYYLSAGVTVGGPLPSGATASSPVYYKRSYSAGTGSPIEVDQTDGPASGSDYFIVNQLYDAANGCWSVTYGRQLSPHTSPCLGIDSSHPYPGAEQVGITSTSSASSYKAKGSGIAYITDRINHIGGTSPQFYPWDYPNGAASPPVSLVHGATSGPGCVLIDSTTPGSFITGSGTGVTC